MSSLYIFIGIITFFFVALIVTNIYQRRKGNTEVRETPKPDIDVRTKEEKKRDATSNSECCGMGVHELCQEKNNLMVGFESEAEYFEDEELDRYRKRPADSYSDNEVEEFREVFYTILDEEKARWIRSLQLREIEVPNQMKDEIVLVISDLRNS